jgi:hypothetical protein
MKALRGTGAGLLVVPLPELPLLPPLVAVVRELELEELALSEAAEPPVDPDNTLALPVLVEADERAEVELTPDDKVLLPARFNTEGVVLSDEPLLLELGVSNELAVDAVDGAPAPEEEPAVFDATAATEPVWEDWMYKSCRLPGLR